jgi:hypothetical protein
MSLGHCIPWTMRSLVDASSGRCVLWTMRPLDSVLWTMRPLEDASLKRTSLTDVSRPWTAFRWWIFTTASRTDKKENKIFLIYKETQKRSVAKSSITNGLLIFGKYLRVSSYTRKPVVEYDFATDPF